MVSVRHEGNIKGGSGLEAASAGCGGSERGLMQKGHGISAAFFRKPLRSDTIVAADGNPPPFFHAAGAASGPPSVMRGMAAGNGISTKSVMFPMRRGRCFLSLLSFFAAIHHKLLVINNLQQELSISNQGKSRLIKANRVIF
jgi:hypothetical protein